VRPQHPALGTNRRSAGSGAPARTIRTGSSPSSTVTSSWKRADVAGRARRASDVMQAVEAHMESDIAAQFEDEGHAYADAGTVSGRPLP